ncbi:MAG: hypothetical protein AB7I68_13890 [Porticoccaceae bacterium]
MKYLGDNEANLLLGKVGFSIGEWNRIIYLDHLAERHQVSYKAPMDALSLYCFSLHVAGWLPKGKWQIFQIDDATILSPDEAIFLSRLICAEEPFDFGVHRTFLFDNDKGDCSKLNITISHLIFALLLFEGHGYLVSSASHSGEMVCIQDGFVYFISEKHGVHDAQSLISIYENNPKKMPSWMFGG